MSDETQATPPEPDTEQCYRYELQGAMDSVIQYCRNVVNPAVRQLIESVNDTLKGQLDLEQHGWRTFEGVAGGPVLRSLADAHP